MLKAADNFFLFCSCLSTIVISIHGYLSIRILIIVLSIIVAFD
jgi:hypothetical protein